MPKKIIIAIVCLFLAGCASNTPYVHDDGQDSRVDTAQRMIAYLKGRNLPGLKDVSVWENPYGPGLKLTTTHYEIYTTLMEPLMLSQVPAFMESAYRGYNNQLPKPIETSTIFIVYLFAERKQWDDFTENFAGANASMYKQIKAGAYYLNGACVAYNIGRERTFAVLGHEGWHQFNSRHFKYRLPSWVDEGIAMLFETSHYDNGLFTFEPQRNLYRLGALKKTLGQGKMIPLRTLVSINPGQVLSDDESVMAFYSQSYALVRFLREEGYGKRLNNFHRLLLDGLNGRWEIGDTNTAIAADRNVPLTIPWNQQVGAGLFERYIGTDFEKLDAEYRLFCRKIVYHVRFR